MDKNTAVLKGRRVLVVEDSPVVGPFTADALEELGCIVIGPAPNMAAARECVETAEIDAALIDVHIRGERAFALCDMLDARGIPFAMTSGYADWQVPEKWEHAPRLPKPYTVDQVERVLKQMLDSGR
jgi:CheY-like chemotaxis protein